MITIKNTNVYGWESAIRGMRNPMNSWDKSDSHFTCKTCLCADCLYGDKDECGQNALFIGKNDLELMKKLSKAGTDHSKFLRMINVSCDIVAPLYWWKEFDTYKVGTVRNSCSTMHKIAEKEFTIDDFSHEHLTQKTDGLWVNADGRYFMCSAWDFCQITCDVLNYYRKKYIDTKDKKYWWQMIQLLPSSYNQRGTVQMNYQVLKNIYKSRKGHKLDEWQTFREWCETLPYFVEICGE